MKFRWNDRPTFDYIGGPRSPYLKINARRYALPDDAIQWSVADQAWAVEQGFFVQRAVDQRDMQRPVIMSMDEVRGIITPTRNDRPSWHIITIASGKLTVRTIKRHALAGDPMYVRLAMFIKQQDEYGWYGAWAPSVEFPTKTLLWYKNYKARMAFKPTPSQVNMLEVRKKVGRPRKAFIEGPDKLPEIPKLHDDAMSPEAYLKLLDLVILKRDAIYRAAPDGNYPDYYREQLYRASRWEMVIRSICHRLPQSETRVKIRNAMARATPMSLPDSLASYTHA